MIVIVLTNCPEGLRGHLTLWLMEVKPGTFVGRVTARVREVLWARVVELCKDGDAVMVLPADNEQGMTVTSHNHRWTPIDRDGITSLSRPHPGGRHVSPMRAGWSKAAKYRKYGSRRRSRPGSTGD